MGCTKLCKCYVIGTRVYTIVHTTEGVYSPIQALCWYIEGRRPLYLAPHEVLDTRGALICTRVKALVHITTRVAVICTRVYMRVRSTVADLLPHRSVGAICTMMYRLVRITAKGPIPYACAVLICTRV